MKSSATTVPRMNFIERETMALTYRNMILIGAVIAGIGLGLLGGQWARMALATRQAARLETEVKALREERDKIFKQMTASSGAVSAKDVLTHLFEAAPPWSALLKELTAMTPRSLWLTSLKSTPKTDAAGRIELHLAGRSEEAGSVARLLQSLASSSLFQNAILSSSKRETGAGGTTYTFAVRVTVAPSEGRGL